MPCGLAGRGSEGMAGGEEHLSSNRTKVLPLSTELPSKGAGFGASNFPSVLKQHQAGVQVLPVKSS